MSEAVANRRLPLNADPLGGGARVLEDLGNLGDFLGGLAVIATLIYLAVQVRQNSQQIAQNSECMKHASSDA